ncbi:type VII secretion target [Umezawaea tangerina]|uniref:Excreted virulence factor EspC (Type VII ESX diderm) n=1 Tax=Umezawaea tangerina TaxID=84725 RepID=A0A2T0SGB7_9PSEU|nr:type VII secretion target [Umezawaea tangerina]PRY32449.1 excreted virulence factor EspC (type VII ESX diderm) [Umezawaea tangerina]
MSGYQVTPGELHTHAGSVRQVADALGQAVEAAQQVTVGVQAYGMICGPLFVPIVMAVSAPGVLALRAARQAITDTANEVEATAEHYDTVDRTLADSFSAIGKELS